MDTGVVNVVNYNHAKWNDTYRHQSLYYQGKKFWHYVFFAQPSLRTNQATYWP
jgi:hypothetical protein